MAYLNYLECCGIKEICDIQFDFLEGWPVKKILKGVKEQYTYYNCPSVMIFSVAQGKEFNGSHVVGQQLRNFIEKKKLGTVTATAWVENKNSGNKIKVFTWTVNRGNFEKINLDK